jgi:uncharacterized RDD family membrane protein YckC
MSTTRTHVVQLRTPEGVAFSFRLASPVLRLAALSIDWAVVTTTWSTLATICVVLQVLNRDLAGLVAALTYFVLTFGYSIVVEWYWRGQSVGKRLLRLRVVDARGFRLSFPQVALRNIMRIVDSLPLAYLVGGITALMSDRSQRLGDIVAGTLVIWEPAEVIPDMDLIRGEKYNSLRAHPGVVARLRQAVAPADARVAWQALARRDELNPDARLKLFAEIAGYFRSLTPVPPELGEGISDEQFTRNVVDVLFVNRT